MDKPDNEKCTPLDTNDAAEGMDGLSEESLPEEPQRVGMLEFIQKQTFYDMNKPVEGLVDAVKGPLMATVHYGSVLACGRYNKPAWKRAAVRLAVIGALFGGSAASKEAGCTTQAQDGNGTEVIKELEVGSHCDRPCGDALIKTNNEQ